MSDQRNEDILSEDLSINQVVADRLQSITKWSRFLGIVGFIFVALFVLFLVAFSTQISRLGEVYPSLAKFPVSILYLVGLVGIAITGVLLYFLLRFASLTQRALQSRSQEQLNKGLESLKTFYAIYAVIGIISLALNLIVAITSL